MNNIKNQIRNNNTQNNFNNYNNNNHASVYARGAKEKKKGNTESNI